MIITAMKQALEALDDMAEYSPSELKNQRTALRQAIEKAEKQQAEFNAMVERVQELERQACEIIRGAGEPVACECHRCIKENDLRHGSFPLSATKMILCPECGNKRCPKASDHRLQCTNSNETGQAGSVYTAPPQAEKQTHTDHPLRHWDRTCPACVAESANSTKPVAESEQVNSEQQEPVVWMYQDKSTHEVRFQKQMRAFVDHNKTYETPLYTTPPRKKWVGLDDEDWMNVPDFQKEGCELDAAIYDWIEARLKEKNT